MFTNIHVCLLFGFFMGLIEYHKPYIYKEIPSVPIIHHIIVCIIINNMLINNTFDLCMITTMSQSD